MLVGLAPLAWAGDDVLVTSLGAGGVRAEALDAGDLDLLLGQRVRYEAAEGATVHLDGRFTLDPDGATSWEESRVRALGVAFERPALTVLAGRAGLAHGGPRLVDGVQVLLHPDRGRTWSLGAWGGLVPDELTTAPLVRPGLGPIVGIERPAGSLTAVGEVVAGPVGLDRAGTFVQARAQSGRALRADGRVDWLFTDGEGRAGLVDGAAFVGLRPADALRVDLLYDAYSSLLYQARADLDPRVQRFAARIEEAGLGAGVVQDVVDPRLHHLLGATVRAEGDGALRPLAAVRGRARLHPDPVEQYARIGPQVGVGGLLGDRVELLADANVLWLEGHTQGDAGLTGILDLLADASATLDGSARVLVDPVGYGGRPGWYADLFVDALARTGTVVAAGGSWTAEPDDAVGEDVGWAAFVRVQQWFRPGAGAARREPVPVVR